MAQEILNTKSKEELLKTPIKALGLEIVGSLLEPVVGKLYQELEVAGIAFRPQVYVTDDWGCPDGIPIIGVPFYLAHAKLRDIEVDKMKTIESEDEIAQTMRHEAGHAFNYVYELYKLPKWQEVFGVYSKPYRDNFAPIAGSDKFVRHLEGWYAQKHPDEDFAETFAVVLTPGFDWKAAYKGTPAFEKLTYVSELVKEYRAQAVPEPKKPYEQDVPIESLTQTLEEWYRRRVAARHPSKKVMLLFYQEYPKKVATRDEVIGQIKEALVSTSRYSVVLLPINQSVERIVSGIEHEKPDLVFNLCETFRDNDRFDFNVTALLELMQIPVTGSSSGGLFLSNDKHLSKKIFDYHRIPYPAFFLVPFGTDPVIPKSMKYPLFVKPVHEDASLGIDEHSLVKDAYALRKKVQEIHKEFRDDVLVEEYIDGREFFISVLGNKIPKPLEVLELDFSKLPSKTPHIYTHKAKIDRDSKEYALIQPRVADNLEPELWGKIVDLGMKVCKALGARDYARVDMRLSNDGKLYVLEANFNPYLAKGSETAIAADAKGLDYHRLISTIVELALARAGK